MRKRLSQKSVQGWVKNLSKYVAQHNWTDFWLFLSSLSFLVFEKTHSPCRKKNIFEQKSKKGNNEETLDWFWTQTRQILDRLLTLHHIHFLYIYGNALEKSGLLSFSHALALFLAFFLALSLSISIQSFFPLVSLSRSLLSFCVVLTYLSFLISWSSLSLMLLSKSWYLLSLLSFCFFFSVHSLLSLYSFYSLSLSLSSLSLSLSPFSLCLSLLSIYSLYLFSLSILFISLSILSIYSLYLFSLSILSLSALPGSSPPTSRPGLPDNSPFAHIVS